MLQYRTRLLASTRASRLYDHSRLNHVRAFALIFAMISTSLLLSTCNPLVLRFSIANLIYNPYGVRDERVDNASMAAFILLDGRHIDIDTDMFYPSR